jgi:hypothetical protein
VPGLIHLVKDNDTVKYLFKKSNKLIIEEYYVKNDKKYYPKQDLPVKLVSPNILNRSLSLDYRELLKESISFIASYLEMPLYSDYLILVLWVFHTYLIEKFNATPLLYFYGVKETGKSRAGEVLAELAFRCERLTSPTGASIFRSSQYFKTTLVIDEIKLWGPTGKQEVANLIKSRYKRGLKVSRVNLNKKGEEQIEYFDVFAPLAICTTESLPEIIESRCIRFLMQKNAKKEVEKFIDQEWANNLREKLTIFRANFYAIELKRFEPIARRRLNEIIIPLYQVLLLVDPARKEEFREIINKMQKDKEEEEGLSLEAEIVEAVIKYCYNGKEKTFLTTEITNNLNENRLEKEKVNNTLIGIRLKRLGFKKIRFKSGKMGFENKEGLLQKLAFQYKINLPEETLF